MRCYLRLIPALPAADDEHALRLRLQSAPGVTAIGEVERHSKGGYAVVIEATSGGTEQLVVYLREHGYLAVI